MSPRYRVTLTKEERNELEALTKKWKNRSQKSSSTLALCFFAMPALKVRLGKLLMLRMLWVLPVARSSI